MWNISGLPMTPSRISSRALTWALAKSWLWPSMRSLPFFRAAATMASQSASVVAMGFSHSTCLPLSSAWMVAEAWALLALHTLTASTQSSSACTLPKAFAPNCLASACARSGTKS